MTTIKQLEDQLRAGKTIKIKVDDDLVMDLVYNNTFSMFLCYPEGTYMDEDANIYCNEDLAEIINHFKWSLDSMQTAQEIIDQKVSYRFTDDDYPECKYKHTHVCYECSESCN